MLVPSMLTPEYHLPFWQVCLRPQDLLQEAGLHQVSKVLPDGHRRRVLRRLLLWSVGGARRLFIWRVPACSILPACAHKKGHCIGERCILQRNYVSEFSLPLPGQAASRARSGSRRLPRRCSPTLTSSRCVDLGGMGVSDLTLRLCPSVTPAHHVAGR